MLAEAEALVAERAKARRESARIRAEAREAADAMREDAMNVGLGAPSQQAAAFEAKAASTASEVRRKLTESVHL